MPARKEITLIGRGKISKKEYSTDHNYYDSKGNQLDIPRFPIGDRLKDRRTQDATKYKDGYIKIKGLEKGDKIYRRRRKSVYALNGTISSSRDGREYELTQTIYLHSDIDTEKEAEVLLKRAWNEKTDFAPYDEFLTEDEFSKEQKDAMPDEDGFLIKSTYSEGGATREYKDSAKTKVTLKSLTLKDFIAERDPTGKTDNSGTKEFKRFKIDR